MALLLNCKSISRSFGPRPLFRDISIAFDDAERTGLIGPNGSGKSTLLKIIAGQQTTDAGVVETRRGLKLGYLPQQDAFDPGLTTREGVLAAQHDAHLDEHDRQVQADVLLGKVGFTDADQPADTLSGGWRKRLAIARELIREPDLLLLDEPTNHLDLAGILWLEELLANARFSFLLVSHDRYFLENVTNRVVELNAAYANGYLSIEGSYSTFLTRRAEYLDAQAARQQSLAGRVRGEIEWLQRGAKARRTKAKGRIQQAGEMIEELADLKRRNATGAPVQIDFAASGRQTRKLLTAKNVSKAYGGRTLLSNLDLTLSPGMKLGLLGPNGSGKSTLIRLLTGEESPDAGEIWQAENLQVVRFDQAREQLDKSQTLRTALSPMGETVKYRGGTMHVSGWAQRFLFRTEQLDMRLGDLSGGEQARILIARLMLQPADVLILDEPTNDLDIPTLEVLEESLTDFAGALVLVTHDRFMLDRLSTELVALDGKGGASAFASLDQWEAAAEVTKAAEKARAAPAKVTTRPAEAKKKLSFQEQRELDGIEAKIMAAEEGLHASQKLLEDPKVLADRNKLHDACEKVDAATRAVKSLYVRWEELEAKQPPGVGPSN